MKEVLSLLEQWETRGLECDGQTRVFTTVLQEQNILHTCMVGTLTHTATNERVPVHFWIELPDGFTVDYRARLWLGESDEIPHGIFLKEEYPQVVYSGMAISLPPLPPAVFQALTDTSYWDELSKFADGGDA